jgi:hypothetical protein
MWRVICAGIYESHWLDDLIGCALCVFIRRPPTPFAEGYTTQSKASSFFILRRSSSSSSKLYTRI